MGEVTGGSWWRQEAEGMQIREKSSEAREVRSIRQQGGGVMKWEPGDGIFRGGSQDAGLERSDAWVGK